MNLSAVEVASAFILGLMGSGHCLSMCGGLMSAFAFQIKADPFKKIQILLGYNIGRILSYSAIALCFSLVLKQGPNPGLPFARTVAGILLIAMGLYIASWWRGLTRLEKMGAIVWRFIKPLGDRWMPINHFGAALVVGAVWGWLPCGLVYSALAYALVQPSPAAAAVTMLAFGLGTLPSVLLGGYAMTHVKELLSAKGVRGAIALLYILFGIWTIFNAWQHFGHQHGAHHNHSPPGHNEAAPSDLSSPESPPLHPHHH